MNMRVIALASNELQHEAKSCSRMKSERLGSSREGADREIPLEPPLQASACLGSWKMFTGNVFLVSAVLEIVFFVVLCGSKLGNNMEESEDHFLNGAVKRLEIHERFIEFGGTVPQPHQGPPFARLGITLTSHRPQLNVHHGAQPFLASSARTSSEFLHLFLFPPQRPNQLFYITALLHAPSHSPLIYDFLSSSLPAPIVKKRRFRSFCQKRTEKEE
ncbi:hypothetical protein SODALDRAFT_376320 [Sodiomyces alkalinus F11]|uniref:Uncharacterized protein n=1 Tax=Sodiomyces alkalinus (strain CBS 110278 / VKM F-3762 / F11) TaxID=1314773 RepID=A0A3N2Q1C7_SODAK|nr:hypothetical protein SODALDRAFT_376320 [Sodiomyces alkalinus F11]ROT40532.1 hypothetical protein SODALDRAFT_376320 [Sodiomyces alkalinus F11]